MKAAVRPFWGHAVVLLFPLLVAALLQACAAPEATPPPAQRVATPESDAEAPFLLHFLDVGQGDAVLLQSPTGQNVLYDGGPSGLVTLAHLQRLDVRTLDLVIASHGHADHIGGLVEIVRHYRPPLFVDNGVPHTTQTWARLMEALLAAESRLVEPTARRISMGEAELQLLPPPGRPGWGQNDNSVGVVLSWGDFRASLAGDAEGAQWAWWLEHHPGDLAAVHVHKASHHGSRAGDTVEALARLRPRLVVIGVSATNAYGHPHAEAVAAYRDTGAEVLRTDRDGTVTVQARRDGSFTVEAARPR